MLINLYLDKIKWNYKLPECCINKGCVSKLETKVCSKSGWWPAKAKVVASRGVVVCCPGGRVTKRVTHASITPATVEPAKTASDLPPDTRHIQWCRSLSQPTLF